MAHTCPRCDQLCHCNGDIDDIDMGYSDKCTKDHDGCTREDYGDDWDPDEEFDIDDDIIAKLLMAKCII